MEDLLKKIVEKLDSIENRLKVVETGESSEKVSVKIQEPKKIEKDPLFDKAVKVIQEHDEVPTTLMQEKLRVDFKRAEKILDQLAEAGFGTTYMGEA